jgi:hypothetical protein
VTIDEVNTISADAGASDVLNSAEVGSTETPPTPSNEVKTPVTEVLGVTHEHPSTPTTPTTAVLGTSLPHGRPGERGMAARVSRAVPADGHLADLARP